MKRLALTLVCPAILVMASELRAQVTAQSYSTGGVATASATGYGNTNLNAVAGASHGGVAHAEITGSGRNGGYATGSSIAAAHGGVAVSRGRSEADGWNARSHVETVAGADHGTAVANGSAEAIGNGLAIGRSSALGTYGHARSDSHATARGLWGGRAEATSDAVSDAVAGNATAQSRVNATGIFGGRAVGRGRAIGLGYGRTRHANVWVRADAILGGYSEADASHINY